MGIFGDVEEIVKSLFGKEDCGLIGCFGDVVEYVLYEKEVVGYVVVGCLVEYDEFVVDFDFESVG